MQLWIDHTQSTNLTVFLLVLVPVVLFSLASQAQVSRYGLYMPQKLVTYRIVQYEHVHTYKMLLQRLFL